MGKKKILLSLITPVENKVATVTRQELYDVRLKTVEALSSEGLEHAFHVLYRFVYELYYREPNEETRKEMGIRKPESSVQMHCPRIAKADGEHRTEGHPLDMDGAHQRSGLSECMVEECV